MRRRRIGVFPSRYSKSPLLLGEERAEKRLSIGLEEEDGKHYAFDPGRAPIFLVDSTLVNAAGKSAHDLRDKQPAAVEGPRTAIGRIELWQGEEPAFTAERDTTGGWHITAPEDRGAKSWKLNSLLGDIDGIEVEEFHCRCRRGCGHRPRCVRPRRFPRCAFSSPTTSKRNWKSGSGRWTAAPISCARGWPRYTGSAPTCSRIWNSASTDVSKAPVTSAADDTTAD